MITPREMTSPPTGRAPTSASQPGSPDLSQSHLPSLLLVGVGIVIITLTVVVLSGSADSGWLSDPDALGACGDVGLFSMFLGVFTWPGKVYRRRIVWKWTAAGVAGAYVGSIIGQLLVSRAGQGEPGLQTILLVIWGGCALMLCISGVLIMGDRDDPNGAKRLHQE